MSRPSLPSFLLDLVPADARRAIEAAVSAPGRRVRASAMAPAARVFALATAARAAGGPLVVVTPDDARARALAGELEALLGDSPAIPVLRLSPLDADPYRGLPAHAAVAAQRVAVLDRLVHADGPLVVVLPATALMTPVPGAATIRGWARRIEPGARVDLDALAREVVAKGYRVMDVVTAPGDFARRGGLFDIWPPQEDAPLRVELFGDEVESVRRFDAGTQRTSARVDGFALLPAREAPIGPGEADHLLDRLMGRARALLADAPPGDDGQQLMLQEALTGLEGAPSLYRADVVPLATLLRGPLVAWEPEEAADKLATRWEELDAAWQESQGDALPPPRELFVEPAEIEKQLADAALVLSELPITGPGERRTVDLGGRPPRTYGGHLDELAKDLEAARATGRPVALVVRTSGRSERLKEVLAASGVPFREADEDQPWAPAPGEIVLAHGALERGVEFGHDGPLLLSEADLFGADPPPPPPKKRRGSEAFLSDLRDLKEGDLVVHVDHGIGRYAGLTRRPGTGDEMLLLEYAAGDRLFVPVTRLDLIQKYAGGEQVLMPLDRLGTPGWDKRRAKVGAAVKEMAGELLLLYAQRRAVRAPAFGPDSTWQREFESAFPHDLTYDQSSALADIKTDLMESTPMDRLLCGDVGYGKTEVALRAAFKVVQEGGQVAVLVPTTVLAFQHVTTMRARMASWPVRVEMISRFVSAADTKKILDDAAKGEVDILIGTHRLLSKDVRFKKLGLLVVDEEQRFGVRHKESIKKLSLGVHSLAMSATPIPRTLQLSLAGVRDLSVIETPPRNRLAIQTHLAPWSPSLVAAAIRNEMRRGGQVYYITPKVQGIEQIVTNLRELVPEAAIVHAHGQMPEGHLEKVMLQFVRGEADVLVATTIIENGLDISRANTILVSQAHRFGLSQLYQMRGRVGRSDLRAYAYLFIPPRRELTPEARQRLAALVEFSELGAGFRIAAMDLEIRGAGEFLGARQSGHITAVGFEMYAEMLEKAVRRLQGLPLPEAPEPVTINLGLPAFIPEEVIPHPGQRLEIYKRLSRADTVDEIRAIMEETEDRFGRLGEPARNLFRQAELRVLAQEQGAVSIDWAGDAVAVRYGERPKVDGERVIQLLQRDDQVRMTAAGVLRLKVTDPRADRIAAASLALRKLAS